MIFSRIVLLILFFKFINLEIKAQLGISNFDHGNFSLEQSLTEAKKLDVNLLLISYNATLSKDVLPNITHPDSILLKHFIVTDIFDPLREMADLTYFRLKRNYNPGFVVMHPIIKYCTI